ncbi:hypothetical protein ACPPVO_22200 [Dactylosporangium sp. McL0621]|uniref:hypothetical protein n=1 Tax=Dactylosporangium sp. McL0621 TaxID=3415678 RepID=UPI003CFB78FA
MKRPPGGPGIWWSLLLVMLMCLGCPAYFVYGTWSDRRDEAAMTPVAAAYLDALIAHDQAKGYALLCRSSRAQTPVERWHADRNMPPSVVGYRIVQARIDPGNEAPDSYFVDIELHYSDATNRTIALPMASEDGGWKVCTQSGY